jgi:teichuronic acid biosynthesis glycosyltransferase TuaG
MFEVKTDLVSIITPAYRAAAFIDETIISVVSQTYQNWELLIAEDCSPDDTRDVIRKWERTDSRIKLVAMERNSGPAMARNAALALSTGRWIAFLDSDDLWLPEKLERTLGHAQACNAALVFTGFRRISANGSHTGQYVQVPQTLSYRQLLGNTVIATSTVLIDRTKVGQVLMRKTYYDDFDCWLQILKRGHVACGLNVDLMRYRVMDHSVSRNKRRSAMHVWRAYRDLEKLNLLSALWYFSWYALRGLIKYRRF